MDNNSKSYVLIQYKGSDTISARLENKGEKVKFENGDVQFCHADVAENLCGRFKFIRVNPLEINSAMLDSAKKRLAKIKEEKEKVERELEKSRQLASEKDEREREMRVELNKLKDKYNRKEITNDEYQSGKEKLIAKWEKFFEEKKSKKIEKKEEKTE